MIPWTVLTQVSESKLLTNYKPIWILKLDIWTQFVKKESVPLEDNR